MLSPTLLLPGLKTIGTKQSVRRSAVIGEILPSVSRNQIRRVRRKKSGLGWSFVVGLYTQEEKTPKNPTGKRNQHKTAVSFFFL
jgi:hypothetical protein